MNTKKHIQTITLGAGCFWCSENIFSRLIGVRSVTSGYANGNTEQPTYEEICTGLTNYVEVVKVIFDNKLISLETILKVFFAIHDPTTINRQGNDVGSQYRSTILFNTNEQKEIAVKKITSIDESNVFDQVIVTKVEPLESFYPAESYHQNYFNNNSENQYCQIVVAKKINKFINDFPQLLKS